MTRFTRNSTRRPFEDSPEDFSESSAGFGHLSPFIGKLLLGVAAVALLFAAWSFLPGLFRSMGDVDVYLRGRATADLKPGARVVLDSQEVGRVVDFESRGGQRFAHLRIDRKYARQIPRESQFEVDSLNDWLPGNVGVRVQRSNGPVSDQPIASGAEVNSPERILPAAIPQRFWLLVAMCAGVLVVVAVLARLLRAGLVIIVGIAVIVAVLAYLNGVIACQ